MLRGVTITGADDAVDPAELAKLSAEFPFVEWGLLWSHTREATPRYPSMRWLATASLAAKAHGLKLALHVCGSAARELLGGRGRVLDLAEHARVRRVQVNGYEPGPHVVRAFLEECNAHRVKVILQVRAEEHLQEAAHEAARIEGCLLFDPSGGRGIEPFKWPSAPLDATMGYAGGIRPDNVESVVQRIYEDAGMLVRPFWIDMESGVRDESDRFDLARVRAVLEKAAPLVEKLG